MINFPNGKQTQESLGSDFLKTTFRKTNTAKGKILSWKPSQIFFWLKSVFRWPECIFRWLESVFLLVKRSLVPYGALSCSIEFCAKSKNWFCSWKLKLLMQLANFIKDAFFFRSFLLWYPFWAWVYYGPLCAFRAPFAP